MIGLTCLVISGKLLVEYQKRKHKFTLNLGVFFFLTGIGYLVWFAMTEGMLDLMAEFGYIYIIFAVITPLILLVFILQVFDTSTAKMIILISMFVFMTILHFVFPEYNLYTFVVLIVMVLNIVLFLQNYRVNNDLKSLGLAIGLIITSIAMIPFTPRDVFLVLASIVWIYTFFFLEKSK